MKKIIALLLCVIMIVPMTACGKKDKKYDEFKFGLICLHDENSTYDKNFIDALEDAKNTLGLKDSQIVVKTGIDESNACYEACRDLVDEGCDIIFADSFVHEDYVIMAAKEFPDVQFCHATGTKAHTENLPNYHNAFANIYEGRYVAGVAAGLKLNEMIEAGKITPEQAVMGYVGAFTYAEVISGYTSFYLGAKSVCPSVTMKVQFTGSWFDETKEKEAANTLINAGCVLISQHADSWGAPTACETAGVPNVSYNGSTVNACPNTFIISSRINWSVYFQFVTKAVQNEETIPADWTAGIKDGAVELSEINEKAAAKGTREKLDEVIGKINNGSVKVFDISTFSVNNAPVNSYIADVDTDAAYTPDTEVIIDGAFAESVKRSAPAFDLRIDGIEILNEAF